MFKSKLHNAILAHVKTKIKAAEQTYKDRLTKHEEEYETSIKSATEVLEQKKAIALEDSIKSVITSLQ